MAPHSPQFNLIITGTDRRSYPEPFPGTYMSPMQKPPSTGEDSRPRSPSFDWLPISGTPTMAGPEHSVLEQGRTPSLANRNLQNLYASPVPAPVIASPLERLPMDRPPSPSWLTPAGSRPGMDGSLWNSPMPMPRFESPAPRALSPAMQRKPALRVGGPARQAPRGAKHVRFSQEPDQCFPWRDCLEYRREIGEPFNTESPDFRLTPMGWIFDPPKTAPPPSHNPLKLPKDPFPQCFPPMAPLLQPLQPLQHPGHVFQGLSAGSPAQKSGDYGLVLQYPGSPAHVQLSPLMHCHSPCRTLQQMSMSPMGSPLGPRWA